MPTNGIADNILYSINGAPIFTYGMVSITAIILAYVTIIETSDVPNENPLETETETKPIDYPIPTEEPEIQPMQELQTDNLMNVNTTPEASIPNEEVAQPAQVETPFQAEQLQESVPQELANEQVTQPTSETPIKQAGKKKQSRKNKPNVSKTTKRKTRTTHK